MLLRTFFRSFKSEFVQNIYSFRLIHLLIHCFSFTYFAHTQSQSSSGSRTGSVGTEGNNHSHTLTDLSVSPTDPIKSGKCTGGVEIVHIDDDDVNGRDLVNCTDTSVKRLEQLSDIGERSQSLEVSVVDKASKTKTSAAVFNVQTGGKSVECDSSGNLATGT